MAERPETRSGRRNGGYSGDGRGRQAERAPEIRVEPAKQLQPLKIYPYGIGQNRLRQARLSANAQHRDLGRE